MTRLEADLQRMLDNLARESPLFVAPARQENVAQPA
jgi:hypothetical protein